MKTMNNMMLTLGMLLCMITLANAADITLTWDATTNTDGYKLYQSIDMGVTWIEVANVQTVGASVTAPDTGLVLYRVSSYNSVGEAIQHSSGAFYNADWTLPKAPTGAGITISE